MSKLVIVTTGDGERAIERLVQFLILVQGKSTEFYLNEGKEPAVIATIDPKLKIRSAVASIDLTEFNADMSGFDKIIDVPKERYVYLKTTTEIELDNPSSLVPLLSFLKYLGAGGSSRGIGVRNTEGEIVDLFGFDGDGADGISKMTLDGKKIDYREERWRSLMAGVQQASLAERVVRRYQGSSTGVLKLRYSGNILSSGI